jgi:GTPase SAR1 family protein
MNLVKKLRAVGAQALVDLPRIAVIGNQSAGKSSLVEAISGIKVPRDAGTCTRCPMECTLSQSSRDMPWQCQISLRFEFDDRGERLDEARQMHFGAVIYQREEVELRIRRAQLAILHPKVPYTEFLNLEETTIRDSGGIKGWEALEFSKNTVCLEITGPDVTDLSFVDLPGIIQYHKKSPHMVKVVEDMVASNIQGNCLILVALPMSDDIENQKAAQLAKDVDPDGVRTIGVLTKPDCLGEGNSKSKQLWLDVIEGNRHQLTHGYYCTRQPGDDDRAEGITSEQARQREMQFFNTEAPWRSSKKRERFGTTNLARRLSELLMQIINDGLPRLQAEIMDLHRQCLSRLAELPPDFSSDPTGHLGAMITKFSNELNDLVKGRAPASLSLVQRNREAYRDYAEKIRTTAPKFHAKPKPDDAQGSTQGASPALEMYLDDVQAHIEKNTSRELPYNVPYDAKVELMKKVTESWTPSTLDCFEEVHTVFTTEVMRMVDSHFHRFGRLQSSVKTFITEEVDTHREKTESLLRLFLQFELTPFTQNLHYFSDKRESYMAHYQEERRKEKTGQIDYLSPHRQDAVAEVLAALARIGFPATTVEDLAKLEPADEYKEELVLMADVRAYFSVSYKRIIDYVPLCVDHVFLYELAHIMMNSLGKKLQVTSIESAQHYLNEEPRIQMEREQLNVQRNRLERMRHELINFGGAKA